jgi:hypothetical protein
MSNLRPVRQYVLMSNLRPVRKYVLMSNLRPVRQYVLVSNLRAVIQYVLMLNVRIRLLTVNNVNGINHFSLIIISSASAGAQKFQNMTEILYSFYCPCNFYLVVFAKCLHFCVTSASNHFKQLILLG